MESASHAQTATEWVNRNAKYNPGSGTRSVLQTMAAAYGANGACLSMNELASLSSVSIATAHRATKKLAEDRVIAITPNAGDYRKGGLTNRYQFYGFDLPPLRSETPSLANMIPSIKKDDTPSLMSDDTPSHQSDSKKSGELVDFGVSGKFEVSSQKPSLISDDTPSLISEPVTAPDLPADYVPLPFDDVPLFVPLEYAGAHVHAAGEKESLDTNTSSSPKEKDKKTPLPAKAGKESARAHAKEQTPAGKEWDDLLAAIGDVFKAYGVEAINYANMFIGKAKKGIWGQCAFAEAVTAVELRRWWTWYRQKNPTVERVKEPPKVFSSITEWRKAIKPRIVTAPNVASREVDPESGVTMTLTEEYLNTLRPSWRVGS